MTDIFPYEIIEENGFYGIKDNNGNILVPCIMDEICNMIDEQLGFSTWNDFGGVYLYKDGLTGFFTNDGYYIAPEYDEICISPDQYKYVRKGEVYGVLPYPSYSYREINKEESLICAEECQDYRISPMTYYYQGLGYYEGKYGLQQDFKKAYDCFEKAAMSGHADSQYYLGTMLASGEGVNADFCEAEKWLEEAWINGHKQAGLDLDDLRKQNIAILELLAKGGSIDILLELAESYSRIDNYDKAIEWYTVAAEQENSTALYKLALLYDSGLGAEVDKQKSFQLFNKAFSLGNISSAFHIAHAYEMGFGTEIDYAKSVEYYRIGAESGCELSMLGLANMLEMGLGTDPDNDRAGEWRKLAQLRLDGYAGDLE